MYATKDNRLPVMERMLDLGSDLTTVNKVSRSVYRFNNQPGSLFRPLICSSG